MQDATIYAGLPDPDREEEFYADVPTKRLVAWIVDSIVIALLTAILIPFTAFTAFFFLPVFWLAIGLAYRIVTITLNSATPGMQLMSLELRRGNGQRFDFTLAVAHTIIYSFCMAFTLLQIVSIVLMLTGARRQGVPDLVLATAAVNKGAARY
ncbi:MAG: RDD family protein [Pseudomonadota bacterium]